MSKKSDAVLVLALAHKAARSEAGIDYDLLGRAYRLAKRLSGRNAGLRYHRPTMKRTALSAVAGAVLIALAPVGPAHARGGASHERTCQHYRDEMPDLKAPLEIEYKHPGHEVNEQGMYPQVVEQFTCPALPGGESMQAIRIVKKPHHKRHKEAE